MSPEKSEIRSPADRAAKIFSVLQGTKHLHEPISGLSPSARDALMAKIAELISRGTPEGVAQNIIQLVQAHVPGFAESWSFLEAEGGATSRLLVVNLLARGEYHSGASRMQLLWNWLYGSALVAIGIGCASFVAYRIIYPEFDARLPAVAVVFQLAVLCFISLGAIVIGIERIRQREAGSLRPVVKPDEWLVERFGPRGTFWTRGKS